MSRGVRINVLVVSVMIGVGLALGIYSIIKAVVESGADYSAPRAETSPSAVSGTCVCSPHAERYTRAENQLPGDAFLTVDLCGAQHAITVDFRFVDAPQGRPLYSIEGKLDGLAHREVSERFSLTFYAQIDQQGAFHASDERQETLFLSYLDVTPNAIFRDLTGDRPCRRSGRLFVERLP